MSPGARLRGFCMRWLDPPGEAPRWGWPETLALLLWAAIVAFALWQHVPWADEMQAWFLAGEVGTRTLLLHSLRYEGTGGLWHMFLKLCHALRLPFAAARCVAAVVQLGAMAMLLRSPLPRALRLALPFTFFLLYQDAVISRSYCLLAVLAFAAARLLRRRQQRLLLLALLLGLMANVSVHGAILSGALAVLALLLLRGSAPDGEGARIPWLRRSGALALLLCLWLLAIVAMTPAYDIDYEAGNNLRRSFAAVENRLGLHAVAPPRLTAMPMYGLAPAQTVVHTRRHGKAFLHRLQRVLSVITFPVSSVRVLALLLAALLVAQALATRRSLRAGPAGAAGLLPWLLLVLVFSSLFLAPRHAGTVFTALVVAAWLTWPAAQPADRRARLLTRGAALAFLLCCGQSIGWSVQTLLHEHRLPYGPGRMTARYLQQQHAGPRSAHSIAGFYYFSISPLLEFTGRNIYWNQPAHRYWLWSTSSGTRVTAQQVLAQHPRLIVVGGLDMGPESEVTADWRANDASQPGIEHSDSYRVVPFFVAHGYRITRLYCGHSWMRGTYSEQICNTVLEPQQR